MIMSLFTVLLVFLPLAMAHMEMSWPYPLRSKYDPATPQSLIDYNMLAPLEASGANFPCKGYHTNTPQNMVTTYTAGSSYNFTLQGSATHGGGSCQLSLSYDNGKTFKVIKSIIGGCPLQKSYDFTIPANAPAGHALFAWSWSNMIGNREFYMNCASVHVTGKGGNNQARDDASGFDSLPNIWVADLASINKCNTNGPNGQLNAVYPNPGSDVVYGNGMSSSDPATAGDCEFPVAARQVIAPGFTFDPQISTTTTVESVSSSETESASVLQLTTVTDYAASRVSTLAISTPTSSAGVRSIVDIPSSPTLQVVLPTTSSTNNAPSSIRSLYTDTASWSTTTITLDCPTTITRSLPTSTQPGTYTVSAPASACTGTSAICPCNVGYSCLAIGSCTWACMAMPNTATPSFQTSVIRASTTSTGSAVRSSSLGAVQSSSAPPVTPSQTPSEPTYVNPNDLRSYLPCVPGTFICTDPKTWYTCDQVVGGTWSYQYPRQVAAGMQCQPFLRAGSSQYGQQGNTPQGFYRDDQYVRASSFK